MLPRVSLRTRQASRPPEWVVILVVAWIVGWLLVVVLIPSHAT